MSIGDAIRAARLRRDLTQSELGAAVGLSTRQIQKYEKQDRIEVNRLLDICEALSVRPSELVGARLRALEALSESVSTPAAHAELLGLASRLTEKQLERLLGYAQGLDRSE